MSTNNSSTGGYLKPTTPALPGGLSLEDFIQAAIVGISGYDPTLVRPEFQVEEPKQPDIFTNWIAFKVMRNKMDTYSNTWLDEGGVFHSQRQQALEVRCSFYGPNASENITAFADGFQIHQNLEALMAAQIGYTDISEVIIGPDLINERWVERWQISVMLSRQIRRTYPILSFASAAGVIHTEREGNIPWSAEAAR